MNLDELKADYEAARIALDRESRTVEDAARAAANLAGDAVRTKYAAHISSLRKKAADARAAYEGAASAAASHPWEGKRVFKMESRGWKRTNRVLGLVRVRRAGDFPGAANQSYGLPSIGEAYIVKLRKDGTPGVRVERVIRDERTDGWQLDEQP